MKKTIRLLIVLFVLLLTYVPILILAFYSFTDAGQIGAFREFTLQNYVTLFTTEELKSMILGTVLLALGAAFLATILGTIGAIGSFYSRHRITAAYNTVNQIPVINADVVTGFSICILLVVVFGISKDTFIPLVIGQVALCAPFVYLSVVPKLKQMDPSLYEAALDLGATPKTALFKVVIPQILSGIVSGFALAVTLSLDDYFIATYTKPATFDTISTYVVNATKGSRTEIKTALWALSTVIFLIVILAVVVMNVRARRKEGEKKEQSPKRRAFRHFSALSAVLILVSAVGGVRVSAMEASPANQGAGPQILTATGASDGSSKGDGREVVLRVCNWEEYIDEGDWGEDEVIDLPSGDIFGENSMVDDFREWYEENYGVKVRVEYSTFGTNEELYNMLTLGDVYDLVCPSEYMIMKLIAEKKVAPLSDGFFDSANELNYYTNGVSPFIREMFETQEIDGEPWSRYAAGFMWGVTGFVYNPEVVSEEDASTWHLLENTDYARQVTVKDNVRDTFFAAVGALKSDLLLSDSFRADPDYRRKLQEEMNDTSLDNIQAVQDYLQTNKDNFYSFETDSGKADMITGKVVANLQWSGDAVYAMDQAEEDDFYLSFAVPEEVTNVYFDGWIMLRAGVEGDPAKQQAAEAFINFVSRPDNAVRNMYYIGYTSAISGGNDPRVFEYLDWNYGAEEDEEDVTDYSVAYFFTDGEDEEGEYTITAPAEQIGRQLFAQYPPEDVIRRSSLMEYFDSSVSEDINGMWIRIRCYNIKNIPLWTWILVVLLAASGVTYYEVSKRKRH